MQTNNPVYIKLEIHRAKELANLVNEMEGIARHIKSGAVQAKMTAHISEVKRILKEDARLI